jgi:hypothetical protein
MGYCGQFGKSELKVVGQQLDEAECLVSGYYCIPPREWPRYPYEVKTMAELHAGEIVTDALAMVSKYEYSLTTERNPHHLLERYGICLQDHNILGVASRSQDRISLESLMLYILTHELVHIIRFSNAPPTYFATPPERKFEECRVHQITQQILRSSLDPAINPVLEVYRDHASGPVIL